jgi:hypothetical protein
MWRGGIDLSCLGEENMGDNCECDRKLYGSIKMRVI